MRYSPEELIAFAHVANLGSFSAAARKLNKSQSTVSISIANLEADIGVALFERQARQTILTDAGRVVLKQVQQLLAASAQLDELSVQLMQGVEPFLSIVFSDVYQVNVDRHLLRFAELYPFTELAFSTAEDTDAVQRVQSGDAHIGIVATQPSYPIGLDARRLAGHSPMGIYVAATHAAASQGTTTIEQLRSVRELLLKPHMARNADRGSRAWSAQNYLSLLEMVRAGFGWAELPCELVERYGQSYLVQLTVPGWPRRQDMDIVWSKERLPGPAGLWLIDSLFHAV